MRRKEKQITDKKQMEQILEQAQVCRLAMVDKGHPYVVPLNFGYRNGSLYFHSALEGRKINVLNVNAQVCFEVDELVKMNKAAQACDWGVSFRSVIGTGTARMLETPAEKRLAWILSWPLFRSVVRLSGGDAGQNRRDPGNCP